MMISDDERRDYRSSLITAAIIFVLLLAILIPKNAGRKKENDGSNFYAVPASITTIDEVRGRIGATDSRGIEWYWYGESDVRLRDMVILVMNNQGTEYIFDDSVENISIAEMDLQ